MPPKPDLKSQLEQMWDPRRAIHKPVGWWQDAAGRAQPPGSYVEPAKRVGKSLRMKDKLKRMLGVR